MGQTIKQTFRLYNTVGLIDKAKNIYYVPHQDVLFAEKTQSLTKVSEVYYKLFNSVCPFSSAYQDVEISQWSPEDRELKIEGLIDDFRQSRGLGLALNYIIIKREIYNVENNTETLVSSYYYAMFITSVRQAGSRSVTLSLTSDYFTNFFYLNNTETLTENYDPFNDSMVNCYVERQHYDRFELTDKIRETTETPISFDNTQPVLNDDMLIGKEYYMDLVRGYAIVSSNYQDTVECHNCHFIARRRNVSDNNLADDTYFPNTFIVKKIEPFIRDNISWAGVILTLEDDTTFSFYGPSNVEYMTFERVDDDEDAEIIQTMGDNSRFEYSLTKILTFTYILKPINQEKMLFGQEQFNFKYQYRDKRIPLPLGLGEISPDDVEKMIEEIRAISTKSELNTYMSSLSSDESILFSYLVTRFIIIKYKQFIFETPLIYYKDNSKEYYYLSYIKSSTADKNGVVSNAFIDIHLPVVDYSLFPNLKGLGLHYCVKCDFSDSDENISIPTQYFKYDDSSIEEYYLGGFDGAKDYITEILLLKYSPLSKNFIGFHTFNSGTINEENRIVINLGNIYDKNQYPNGAEVNHPNYDDARRGRYYLPHFTDRVVMIGMPDENTINPSNPQALLPDTYIFRKNQNIYSIQGVYGFLVGSNGYEEQSIKLKEDFIELNKYIEPILESNPYKFYSISLYENETSFKKDRYYQSLSVETNGDLIYNVNVQFVQSFIETYKVGVVPAYTVNLKKTLYFSEALVLTLPAGLPIITNAYMSFYYQNKAQMKNQYAVNDINYDFAQKETLVSGIAGILGGGVTTGLGALTGNAGAIAKGIGQSATAGIGLIASEVNVSLNHAKSEKVISATQQAKLADMGAKPNTVKLAGSDVVYEASLGEMGIYLNHYTIDDLSYNTIAKILERTGYKVDIMDNLNPFSRVGLDYIKLVSFDFVEDNYVLSQEQMEAIAEIFTAGVTLLHDNDYLHHLGESGYHNIEKALS